MVQSRYGEFGFAPERFNNALTLMPILFVACTQLFDAGMVFQSIAATNLVFVFSFAVCVAGNKIGNKSNWMNFSFLAIKLIGIQIGNIIGRYNKLGNKIGRNICRTKTSVVRHNWMKYKIDNQH